MRIDWLLNDAQARLALSGSASPRLDAEVLLGHVLRRDRTWLYTWGDCDIDEESQVSFESLIRLREAGEPVAYLVGMREFWGLSLQVGKSTLIPRPDTECLVEAALEKAIESKGRVLDLGTGSGAIALAFASERPGWQVTGVDLIQEAVELARLNGQRLGLGNARFMQSHWFEALGHERFDLILSNPPYLAPDDPHLLLGDVRFEPRSALVAGDDGMADLRYLSLTARQYLEPGGWLVLEHGMTQGYAVQAELHRAGYGAVETRQDLGNRPRLSLGQLA